MDATVRHWWRLVDALSGRLGRVHRWLAGPGAFRDAFSGHIEEFHAVPTIEVCLAGTMRIEKPDARVSLQAGDLLLIAPGVWHRAAPMQPGSVRFAQGFLPTCSELLFQASDREWKGRVASEPSRQLMEAACRARDGSPLRGQVLALLRNLAQEPAVERLFDSPALARMVERLWARTHRGLSVAELVRASGLSRTHAYRLFTREYGQTPKAAIAAIRFALADSLLRTGVPVAEAARRCGFPSTDTFRRAWRLRHGSPPSATRQGAGGCATRISPVRS